MNLELVNKIGPRTVKTLNKLNIFTVEDLLNYYPYKYNFIHIMPIEEVKDDVLVYVRAIVFSDAKVQYIKRNFNRLNFVANSGNQNFKVTIFNRAFLKQHLVVNKEILLIGKYNQVKNTFVANDIKFNVFSDRIEPIYHLTEGVKNGVLSNYIEDALKLNCPIDDFVPEDINLKYNLISKMEALQFIHQPRTVEEVKKAKLKLIYEELFVYMFKIHYLKLLNKKSLGLEKTFLEDKVQDFLSFLPFKLTEDQLLAINDILNDIKSPKRMNRLVLGDVGSGKTIIAIVAILANYLAGYQSTFMAPTEILAKQHYESVNNYFKDYGIRIVLLTGSMSKKAKEKVYEDIKQRKIDLVIGTHALLNEKLEFANLGLVITDEQHRFGVNQRNLLQNKGKVGEVDVIYLSATPIPRTYALTIYGDLDISNVKTKPKMRKEVITRVKSEKEITDVLKAMYEELCLGHQVFVVSPLIETNEELDLNSVNGLKEKMTVAFSGKMRIEVLHGKLKQKEKDELMEEFQKGDIKILISTTVIEVGIDIPNATMMVIFNAERFGLATLHQLRGRVGRNDLQSYCYLVSNTNDNARLKVMEESTDGFYISEKDFELRGQGDLFGIKQSGDMIFKIADLRHDMKILMQAKEDAEKFIADEVYKENALYKNIIDEINFLVTVQIENTKKCR